MLLISYNPYFYRAPLIINGCISSLPLFPYYLSNKGIREKDNKTDQLLRELSKNKGFDAITQILI